MPGIKNFSFICLLISAVGAGKLCAEEYMSQQAFLKKSFAESPFEPHVFWLTSEMKSVANTILGHRYQGLRVRYWQAGSKTAWVLNEIGKERPIRIGIVVKDNRIQSVDILAFEESRGWEVRFPFFTDQFAGVALDQKNTLDKSIDGITGATLSVRAVTNTSRLALYLHQHVMLQPLTESQAP